MSWSKGSVAVELHKEEPIELLYTHCYGHALNLACSDADKSAKSREMVWIHLMNL